MYRTPITPITLLTITSKTASGQKSAFVRLQSKTNITTLEQIAPTYGINVNNADIAEIIAISANDPSMALIFAATHRHIAANIVLPIYEIK